MNDSWSHWIFETAIKKKRSGYPSWGNGLFGFMLSDCAIDFSCDIHLNYICFWPEVSPNLQGSEEALASGTRLTSQSWTGAAKQEGCSPQPGFCPGFGHRFYTPECRHIG